MSPEIIVSPLDSKRISSRLVTHFLPHTNVVIPNCCTGFEWEADLFVLRNSGWAEEVEIKVSKADFRREFLKKDRKHQILQHGEPDRLQTYGFGRPDFGYYDPQDSTHVPIWTEKGSGNVLTFEDWSAANLIPLKRFWFAMPFYLAEELEKEIPEYAGLFALEAWGPVTHVRTIKEAPKLPFARKVTDAERIRLLRSCYHRYWDVRRKLETMTEGRG